MPQLVLPSEGTSSTTVFSRFTVARRLYQFNTIGTSYHPYDRIGGPSGVSILKIYKNSARDLLWDSCKFEDFFFGGGVGGGAVKLF